ncbi:MAG TPA: hypothetical protein VKF38_07635 [Anaerolineaceae bacterium]|nr:hypothetical protein [Anaerolineaceae bacterium]
MDTSIKILETPGGFGKVYQDDKELAKVEYCLTISQQLNENSTPASQSTVPGHKEISGQFRILEGKYLSVDGKILTLHLADGRQWKFIIVGINHLSMYIAANAPGGDAAF